MAISSAQAFAIFFGLVFKIIPLCFGILKVSRYRSLGVVFGIAIAVFAVQVILELAVTLALFGGFGIMIDFSSVFVLTSYLLTQAPISQLQIATALTSFAAVFSILAWCNHMFSKVRAVQA
jgi:hypothetical protein